MVEVQVRDLGWRHAGRREWALRGLDLTIPSGQRVLLLGASGSGKSTLLRALAGLLAADSGDGEGEALLDGVPVARARERVGIVFQDPQTQLVLSRCGDDVAFGLENRGVPPERIWPQVARALRRVGFPYHLDHSTAALSGGEQQRLALAGALATDPGLLLLDEPTANLDPAGAALVRTALAEAVRADTTVVLVEHRIAAALPLVDRVVALGPGGGLLADGPPETVFADHGPALAAAGVWVPGHPLPRLPAAGPAGAPLLSAEKVRYRRHGADRDALPAVDAVVREGEALAVVGPNGGGKSTLALLLGGLIAPTSGVLRAAEDLAAGLDGPPHRWPATGLSARIGSVFQNPEHQFVRANVRDELALGPRLAGHPREHVDATVDDLLDRLGLAALAAANPFTLSGGQARRLSVGAALAAAPRVLVLDEPTFGQDRNTWIALVQLLAGLRDAGAAIVAVTHDDELLATLADRVMSLGGPPTGER
ncbi:ABC transporter ATP-binding protein [Pilimelia columellifera]|uniref:ATP-binding cassette domain-containing protein n=1 Tax=Pilimelia columellifera subsp. columellifera TaxID=706583 RepID=A0ABP6AZN6_9ACTN